MLDSSGQALAASSWVPRYCVSSHLWVGRLTTLLLARLLKTVIATFAVSGAGVMLAQVW